MNQEQINRILVEKGERGCWHEDIYTVNDDRIAICGKCEQQVSSENEYFSNPNFSQPENFFRMLKIAKSKGIYVEVNISLRNWVGSSDYVVTLIVGSKTHRECDIDKIPALVSAELARIIEEKK